MSKEIKLGDIVNGSIPNPDGQWQIDGNGNLVLSVPNDYDMSGVDITNLNSVSTGNASITKLHDGRMAVNAADPAGILSGSNIVQKINSAFSAIESVANTGVVVVPSPGSAYYNGGTDTISIPRSSEGQGYHLVGLGTPEIRWSGSMASDLIELPPGSTEQETVVIRNLELTSDSGASIPHAVDLADCTRSVVSQVKLGLSGRVDNACLRLRGENVTTSRNQIEQVFAKPSDNGSATGIQIGDTAAANVAPLNEIRNCEINGDVGVHLTTDGFQTRMINGGVNQARIGVLVESPSNHIKTRWEGSYGSGGDVEQPLILRGDDNEVVRQQGGRDRSPAWIETVSDEGIGNTIRESGENYYKRWTHDFAEADPTVVLATDHSGSGSLNATNTASVNLDTGTTADSVAAIRTAKKFKRGGMNRAAITVRPRDTTDAIHTVRMRQALQSNFAGVRYDPTSGVSASNWLLEMEDGSGNHVGNSPVDSGVTVNADEMYQIQVNARYDLSADAEQIYVGVRSLERTDTRGDATFADDVSRYEVDVRVDNGPSSGASKQIDVHRVRRGAVMEGF